MFCLRGYNLPSYRYTRPVLFEMAVAVEESARDFYTTLSEKFSRHEALFKQLANDEEAHAKRYSQLLSGEEIYATEEERKQADSNIQLLEKNRIIGNLRGGAARAQEVSDLKSAIEAAVQQEKNTVIFYYNISMALGKKDRQKIHQIILAEHGHLTKVQHLARALNSQSEKSSAAGFTNMK